MSNVDNNELKNKLAERAPTQASTEVARQEPPTLATMVRQSIEKQSSAFRAVMPKGVDSDRFARLVLTAVKSTPQLMECFGTEQGQVTVLLAAMQAAAVGLEPNTATQQCWLLPRRRGQVVECQLSIGYRGLLKLVRRSGTIKSIFAEVVHEKDVFSWARGLEEDHLEHVPFDGEGDAGPLTHVYAVARFKDGGYQFVVLNKRHVEQRRAQSDSFKSQNNSYSPWVKWPEEMWRKTAIRALVPYLDMETDAADAVTKDETQLRFNADDGVIDVVEEKEPQPAPALPSPPDEDEEELKPAAQDVKAQDSARKALMAQATKTFPLAGLKGKAQTGARDVLRHVIAFCELGEHKSSNDMTTAEIRRVHRRLEEVEQGSITVTADDEHHRVLVKTGDQEIAVTYEQIEVE